MCLSFCPQGGKVGISSGPRSLTGCRYGGGLGILWDWYPRGSYHYIFLPPILQIPCGGHQHRYRWQVGGTHPTGMLSFFEYLDLVGNDFLVVHHCGEVT